MSCKANHLYHDVRLNPNLSVLLFDEIYMNYNVVGGVHR